MNLNETFCDYWTRRRRLSIQSFCISGVDECGLLLVCYLAHTVNTLKFIYSRRIAVEELQNGVIANHLETCIPST